jgi:FAD:protein FMN transferase
MAEPFIFRKLRTVMALLCLCPVRIFLPVLLLLSGWPGHGADRSALRPHEYELSRMGTMFRIVLYDTDDLHARGAAMAAFDRIEELEAILSDYREDSEVTSLCRDAGVAPRAVSPELFSLLEQSLRISRLTGGAFDVTIGPVVQLWRQARKAGRVPDPEALRKARAAVGYGNIELNADARTVWLKTPGMKLDFGAIGKGYAGDEAIAVLKSRGVTRAMVDGGGDLVIGAAPPGAQGWKVAVREPEPGQSAPGYLYLHDVGIATSGDAFQYLESEGRRYSHIVNPSSGEGVRDSAEATVIAPDGATADALATALSVMPVAEGMRLIESMEGASAAVVRRSDGGLKRTSSKRFPKAVAARRSQRASGTASGQR